MPISILRVPFALILLLLTTPTYAATPKLVSEKMVSLTGRVETRREASMLWYSLNTGKGQPVLIGATYAFSGANGDCLEKAETAGSPVTISGKLTMYDNGSGGFDQESVQCSNATASAGSAKPLKLNDKLHAQFMQNEQYALADALLNATWKQIKPNVSEAQFKQILQEQRQWASKGRDEAASRYSASMPDVAAFTKAMQDRATVLAGIVTSAPVQGTFDSKDAEFTVSIQGDTISIVGDAGNDQGNTCSFDGKGTVNKGWITMKHDDFADFYVFFTRKGAQIAYTSDNQGCGVGVRFDGNYTRK